MTISAAPQRTTDRVVEICVGHVRGALDAAHAGADRLELCAGLEVGGTTPSAGTLQTVLSRVQIPVRVMVRPRGGGFTYDADEFDSMLRDIDMIRTCPNPNAAPLAIVAGVLTPDLRIDVAAMRRIVRAAGDLPVITHKAIDLVPDLRAGIEDVVDAGCRGILTSGGAARAQDATDVLADLISRYSKQGEALEVTVAGSVRADNVASLVAATGARAVHLRAAGLRDSADATDPQIVRDVLQALGRG